MRFGSLLRRELKAQVRLPQTYAISAAYLVISGIFFVNILISTEIPDLAQYYSNIAGTLLVLVPIVAMRSFAEERRSGALDITLSWPLSRRGLVGAKFIANTVFVWLLSSIVWIYFGLVSRIAGIQFGRTAGGYLGLLLLGMAFNALALMVSARASSPTAAAFMGFGLLLVLWILQYAPGWIGDSLRSFGPAAHFEPFTRGVIYAGDVGYFCVAIGIGLGLTTAVLNRDRPGPALSSLARRGAALGAVMAILTGGSALANQVGGKIDLTPSKQNTLTDVSRHVLRGVHDPIRLTAFVEPLSKEASQLKQLAKQYRQAGARITLEVVDPDVQPARTRQAGVTLYGQVLVAIGDRHELLESADQIALTSAVHRLSAAASPQACFTVGHGERDITDQTRNGASALAGALRSLYFDVKPVALGALGAADELRACAVVVVAGPRVPMLPVEVDRLTEYARADGRLLVMGDGVALQRDSALREQLNGLLSPWGLSFGSGIISDLSALADDPSSIVSTDFPSASPPVLRLREQALPVVLVNAVAVERSEGSDDINVSPLVRSSPKSWVAAPPGQHLKGPFLVAADSDRSRLVGADEEHPSVARTRIGAVGSVDVMSNRVLEILGNRDFVVSLVQWIARSDDLVHALRPLSGFYKLVLTEAQKHRLVREGIVLPAVAVLLPLPLSVRRIRRG